VDAEQDAEAARQRALARRSTYAGVGGIVLVVLAMLLTFAHVLGNVLPTVLALAGVGSLLAGVSTGAMQIVDRYRRPSADD
jgi:hypothetical protein